MTNRRQDDIGANECAYPVADHWKEETDDWIKPETQIGAGNANRAIHEHLYALKVCVYRRVHHVAQLAAHFAILHRGQHAAGGRAPDDRLEQPFAQSPRFGLRREQTLRQSRRRGE